MKLNLAYPATGQQKLWETDDEQKLRALYDRRIGHEIEGDALGAEFKGYVFRISGGNDKQGFPMKQGVATAARVRLLLKKGHSCYRQRKRGERKRKSVRGCIVSQEISVLNLVVKKKGDNDIPGLTDAVRPRRLGPKRATKIRKLFDLGKHEDVRPHVVRREIVRGDDKKPYNKAPKIQRLVTPQRLQHKRARRSALKARHEKSLKQAEVYMNLVKEHRHAQKAKRQATLSRRRASSKRASEKQA